MLSSRQEFYRGLLLFWPYHIETWFKVTVHPFTTGRLIIKSEQGLIIGRELESLI